MTAARALILIYKTGLVYESSREVTRLAFKGFYLRVRDDIYIQMPADLDQFGRDDSHRAVVSRKCLIQLGH